MRLGALICCLASPLAVLIAAPVASPPLRSSVRVWVARQMLPPPTPSGTPEDEGSIVLSQGEHWCGRDNGGAYVCLLLLSSGRYRILPSLMTNMATDTPVPTDTPWPGSQNMPTAVPDGQLNYGYHCSGSPGASIDGCAGSSGYPP